MKKNSLKPIKYMLSYVVDSNYIYKNSKYTDEYFYLPDESSFFKNVAEISFPYESEFKNYIPSKFNPFVINNIEYTIYTINTDEGNRNRILLIQENIDIDLNNYDFNSKDIKDGFDFGYYVAISSNNMYPQSKSFLIFLNNINYFLSEDVSWQYYFSDYNGFLKGYYSFIKDKNIRETYINLYPTNPLIKYIINFYRFIKNNDGEYSGMLSNYIYGKEDIYRKTNYIYDDLSYYYINIFLFNKFIEWGIIEEDKDFRIKVRKLNSDDVEEIIRERLKIKSKNPLRRSSSVKKKKKSSIRRFKKYN